MITNSNPWILVNKIVIDEIIEISIHYPEDRPKIMIVSPKSLNEKSYELELNPEAIAPYQVFEAYPKDKEAPILLLIRGVLTVKAREIPPALWEKRKDN